MQQLSFTFDGHDTIKDQHGKDVAVLQPGYDNAETAALFVAAPKMKTALESAVEQMEQCERMFHDDEGFQEALKEVREALELAGKTEPPAPEVNPRSYSVLLLYPDYMNEGGTETYLAYVQASTVREAITEARLQAMNADGNDACEDGEDFAVLMVMQGNIIDIKTHYKEQ